MEESHLNPNLSPNCKESPHNNYKFNEGIL